MAQRSFAQLAADLRSEPSPATIRNILDALGPDRVAGNSYLRDMVGDVRRELPNMSVNEEIADTAIFNLLDALNGVDPTIPAPTVEESAQLARQYMQPSGGARRRRRLSSKLFDKCVKSVRKTVKARKGSTKESAAIAICTVSVLHPRGKTMKRYRKGHLKTQRR